MNERLEEATFGARVDVKIWKLAGRLDAHGESLDDRGRPLREMAKVAATCEGVSR